MPSDYYPNVTPGLAQVPAIEIPLPELDTHPSTWAQFQDILSFVKNWLVIITCMAILYSLYEAHAFIIHLQDGLQQLAHNIGG
jgi:hypothetical protein